MWRSSGVTNPLIMPDFFSLLAIYAYDGMMSIVMAGTRVGRYWRSLSEHSGLKKSKRLVGGLNS